MLTRLAKYFAELIIFPTANPSLSLSLSLCVCLSDLHSLSCSLPVLRSFPKAKLTDEALLRRKAELDMNAEKRRMQKTLEGAVAQLRNSQADVVDRTLISNLIISYFKRKRWVSGRVGV